MVFKGYTDIAPSLLSLEPVKTNISSRQVLISISVANYMQYKTARGQLQVKLVVHYAVDNVGMSHRT